MGVRATGLQSFKHVILFFFGMGTMMDFLKHEGTTDRERDRLKMSVKTPASWKAHALSTRPGIPSGPTALRMFTRLKDRVTSATESVSGLTSSAAAALMTPLSLIKRLKMFVQATFVLFCATSVV